MYITIFIQSGFDLNTNNIIPYFKRKIKVIFQKKRANYYCRNFYLVYHHCDKNE